MRRIGVALCLAAVFPATSAAAKSPLPGIRTPSGNISCYVAPGRPSMLRCDIKLAAYSTQLQQRCLATATVDWHGFELSPFHKGTITCSGGILYDPQAHAPHYVTLPYGKSWSHGPFGCHSAVDGLTCGNHTGHGIFISRESWRRW
jgi:hypothetical protein